MGKNKHLSLFLINFANFKKRGLFFLALLCTTYNLVYKPALAQVVVSPPTTAPITDTFRIRDVHPVYGNRRPHRGIDYATAQGTILTTVSPVTCHSNPGGYGAYAISQLGCGVQLVYAHLSECRSGGTSVKTGGAIGTLGAGGSTGAHLHFEVRVTGCHFDPQAAFGQNLCDGTVRTNLIADAQSKLGSLASCSASAGGNQTDTTPQSSPDEGEEDVIVVEPGDADPVTGLPNVGPPYIYVKGRDGRIRRDPLILPGQSIYPPLPPTTENVVPLGGKSNPVTGCATDTWIAMTNQAILETRREMAYNQMYIGKADSILAYSCFSHQAMTVGKTLGIFSESVDWYNRNINIGDRTLLLTVDLGNTSLDGAINTSSLVAYENYLNGTYVHGFLGGMLEEDQKADSYLGAEGYSPQAYAMCGTMAQVWAKARCTDVGGGTMFKTFEELVIPENDPRIYPENMECRGVGITENMISIAQGRDLRKDSINPYLLDFLAPASGCAPAIKTGVTVVRRHGLSRVLPFLEREDGVCITPGCSYQGGNVCSP